MTVLVAHPIRLRARADLPRAQPRHGAGGSACHTCGYARRPAISCFIVLRCLPLMLSPAGIETERGSTKPTLASRRNFEDCSSVPTIR